MKNNYFLLKIFTLNFFSILLYASVGTIAGKVNLANDRTTIDGIQVYVKETNFYTATDKNGSFTVKNIQPGIYTLEVSLLGYKKQKLSVEVVENVTTNISVTLQESPFQLNEVVVTGSLNKHLLKETPVITEIISNKDLQNSGSSEVGEILRLQTGIEIGTSISQTSNVRLQGLRKNQVLILVDGERVSGKVDDAIDINQIPVQTIERIEIVKGPMSSIYGSDAIGGVVNIITKEQVKGTSTALGSVTFGTNGRQDYIMSVGHSIVEPFGENTEFNVLLSGGWNKYFGVDYNLNDYFMEIPEYDRKNASLKINAKPIENLKLDFKADIYKDNLEWYAGIFDPIMNYYYTDYSSNKKNTYTIGGQYTLGSSVLKISGNLSSNNHGSSERTSTGYLVRSSNTMENISTLRSQFTFSPYNTSTLTLGGEKNSESVESQRILGIKKEITNNIVYVEDEWAISNVTLNFGARYSNNSRYGNFFAPRFSVMLKTTERLTLRASYGRGFRSPSLLELFIDYNNAGVGYTVVGEPLLQPEKSHGFNFGFDYARDEMIWFRLNAYYNSLTNLIDYYYKSVTSPILLSYRNISAATAKGVDLDVDMRPIDDLGISIGYNYNQTKDGFGNELPFHSPHTVNMKIHYSITELNSTITIRGRHYSRQLVKDEQTNTSAYGGGAAATTITLHSPTYQIVDANITTQFFTQFELSAGLNNILDKKVYPFGQIKGREFFAGIRYQL